MKMAGLTPESGAIASWLNWQRMQRRTIGADGDLPKLNQALDMARTGEVDVLVVRELTVSPGA